MRRTFTCISAVLSLLGLPLRSGAASLPAPVVDFFDLNCVECHNPVDKEGELDLESLTFNPTTLSDRSLWARIHDRVKAREMPPPDDSLVEADERQDFLRHFEATLHRASAERQARYGRVPSRRLNRVEYENTIHELLGIRLPLGELLPEDQTEHGFTNIAHTQQISQHLLQKYLHAVDLSLDEAFQSALYPRPTYRKEYPARTLGVGRERIPNERQGVYDAVHDELLSFPTTHGYHGRMPATTVPATGWYRVTIQAQAHNPPPGRNVWTRVKTGILRAKAPATYWVGMFEATRELQEFTFDAWIREEHMIGIRPIDKTLTWVPTKAIQDLVILEEDSDAVAVAVKHVTMERIYPGLEPDALRQRLFDDLAVREHQLVSDQPTRDLRRLMTRFAGQAFRRPVAAADLEPYFEFAEAELAESGSLTNAVKAGYRALLCSHRFLYFNEDAPGRLDAYSVASRLSYFLWSTMPDDELLALAATGELLEPDLLWAQVERMLADPKAAAFVTNFTDSWLNLRDITFTTPDDKLYPEFDDILLHSMLEETRAFLACLIDENLSVTHLIASDFTILNERLAHHYGLHYPLEQRPIKVPLAPDDHRGGIITQASVLKVTANGTTTSPIIRGVWLLERILGQHIPPPPDQVPAIEPDIRGAVSIRDQMDKHRSTAACMSCHKIIDPPGFALENYDVIGGWRDHYRAKNENEKLTQGPAVDASYTLPDGRAFHNIVDFKQLALTNPDQIARNLLNQVLTYATGAEMEFADRREVDRMVAALAEEGYGLRSLIHAATQSQIFLSK